MKITQLVLDDRVRLAHCFIAVLGELTSSLLQKKGTTTRNPMQVIQYSAYETQPELFTDCNAYIVIAIQIRKKVCSGIRTCIIVFFLCV